MDTKSSFENPDGDVDKNQCRTCLVLYSRNQVYPLDSRNLTVMEDGSEQTIAEMYHQCTQLVYEPADEHPKWICQYCTEKMIELFQFRKMCINSYNTFRPSRESKLANKCVKVEIVCVSDNAVIDNGDIGDGVVVKTENGDDIPIIEAIECTSNNSSKMGNCLNDKDEGDMTLRKRTNVEEKETNMSRTNTDKYENDKQGNDDDNDSDFNGFDDCDQESSDASSMSDHMSSPKKRKINTSKAAKITRSTTEKSKPSAYLFACDKCPRKFFKEYRYDAHMRRHNGLKAYQCKYCDKEFQKYHTLKEHTAISHHDKTKSDRPAYICDIDGCGKEYARKQTLQVHIKVVHMGEKLSKIPKICEQCGLKFKDTESLVRHSYTHTGHTPYKCDVCDKMLSSAKGLKEHKLRHDGIKNFTCPTCGMPKTTKNELRMHMIYHSNVKYPCELCSTVFTNKENMKRHVRVVHHGVRAYPCPHCDQSFGKAETLKNHVARHTGVKPHACQICDKRFIQSVALRTHMKTHNKT